MKKLLLSMFFLILFCTALVSAEIANHIVISEVQTAGGVANDEFIELYNPTSSSVDLTGWKLRKNVSGSDSPLVASFLSVTIPAHGYILITHQTEYDGSIGADLTYSGGYYISNDNAVLLYDDSNNLIDKVGYGSSSDYEGAVFSTNPTAGQSIERNSGFVNNETEGNGWDTNNNLADFFTQFLPNPQNSSSTTEHKSTKIVCSDPLVCDYTTIQGAINAASPGDLINVSTGIYTGDLSIPAGKDNLELVGEDKTTTTIKGVLNVPVASWPLAVPNIDVQADGVKIHGFTIEGPAYVADYYASGMLIDGINVEIYDNNFVNTAAETLDELAHAITTYSKTAIPTADVSGLNIYNNTIACSGAAGCEAIYINPHIGTGTITIDNNQLSGTLTIGMTIESGNTDVTNNIINSNVKLSNGFGYGIRFMDSTYEGNYENILISGNDIQNFERGIRVGNGGDGASIFVASILSNTLSNNDVGIWTRKGSQVTATYNSISGNTVGIQNDIATVVNAIDNWWGTATPDFGTIISGSVDYDPWFKFPIDQDSDEDGITDNYDECPNDPDNDADNDNVCGDVDNCPADANEDQADIDNDYIGDACDDDDGKETETVNNEEKTLDLTNESSTKLTIETNSSVTVTVTKTNVTDQGQFSGSNINGFKTIEINTTDDKAVQFPVYLEIYYTNEELLEHNMNENQLVGIFYYNESAGEWKLLNETGVNTADVIVSGKSYSGYLWANLYHFSQYAPGSDVTPPDTGDVLVSPDVTNQSTDVIVTANVTDPQNVNWSSIILAEYFIDAIGVDGNGTNMTAADGAYDNETSELVTATIETSVLSKGNHTVFVHGKDISNNWGNFSNATFTINNIAPTITLNDLSFNEESYLEINLSENVEDLDNELEEINWSYYGTSTNLTIDINNNTKIMNISADANFYGERNITIVAYDGSDSSEKNITITVDNVNDAPTLAAITNQNVNEDSLLQFYLNGADIDPGDTLTYLCNLTLLDVDKINNTLANVTWTPTNDYVGNHNVNCTVTDVAAEKDSKAFIITVNNTNDAPVLDSIGDKTAREGINLTFNLIASDIDPVNDTLTFGTNASFVGEVDSL